MIDSMYTDYSNALWNKDYKQAADSLKKIYERGTASPFSTNIILRELPSQTIQKDSGILKFVLNMRKYIKRAYKVDAMQEVQPAKKEFIETIKSTYPHTAPLRQILVDFGRFNTEKTLPKASKELKAIILEQVTKICTKEEVEILINMCKNLHK